jgi:hypothetical protein
MYYNVEVATLRPFKRKLRPVKSLKNIVLHYVAHNDIKFNNNILPEELCDELIALKWRPIHPMNMPKYSATDFYYSGNLVNINKYRISSIVFDNTKCIYMKLISINPIIVRILSKSEDKFLNNALLDYVQRSHLTYINLRSNPYID